MTQETITINGKEVAIKEGYELVTDPTLPKMADWLFWNGKLDEWDTLSYVSPKSRCIKDFYIRPILRTKEDLERNGYVIFYGKHDELLKGDYVYYSDNCDVEEFQDNTRYLATAVYRHKSKLTKAEPVTEVQASEGLETNELTEYFKLGYKEGVEFTLSKIKSKLKKLQRKYFMGFENSDQFQRGQIVMLYELLDELTNEPKEDGN